MPPFLSSDQFASLSLYNDKFTTMEAFNLVKVIDLMFGMKTVFFRTKNSFLNSKNTLDKLMTENNS